MPLAVDRSLSPVHAQESRATVHLTVSPTVEVPHAFKLPRYGVGGNSLLVAYHLPTNLQGQSELLGERRPYRTELLFRLKLMGHPIGCPRRTHRHAIIDSPSRLKLPITDMGKCRGHCEGGGKRETGSRRGRDCPTRGTRS